MSSYDCTALRFCKVLHTARKQNRLGVTCSPLAAHYDDQYWQTGQTATVIDAAGRTTKIESEAFGTYTLVPHPELSLTESGGRAKFDGKIGTHKTPKFLAPAPPLSPGVAKQPLLSPNRHYNFMVS